MMTPSEGTKHIFGNKKASNKSYQFEMFIHIKYFNWRVCVENEVGKCKKYNFIWNFKDVYEIINTIISFHIDIYLPRNPKNTKIKPKPLNSLLFYLIITKIIIHIFVLLVGNVVCINEYKRLHVIYDIMTFHCNSAGTVSQKEAPL